MSEKPEVLGIEDEAANREYYMIANNKLHVIDLEQNTTRVVPLGFKEKLQIASIIRSLTTRYTSLIWRRTPRR